MTVNAPSSVYRDAGTHSPEDLEFQDDVFRIKANGYTILRGVWSPARYLHRRIVIHLTSRSSNWYWNPVVP
jgi:hypothetical protein